MTGNGRLGALFLGILIASLSVCRPALAGPPGADLAAAEAAVRKADADWAAAANTAGVDAWMSFYGTDSIVLLPNDHLVSGTEQVRDAVTHLLTLPRLVVAWHPVKIEMARSGDLAYLTGAYELRFGDSHGMPLSDRGKILELWKKQPDGAWKCVLDTWNSDGSAAQARAEPPSPALPATEPQPPRAAAHPLTPAVVKYGDMPVHYEEAIHQYFQEHLRDPDSVQYQEITRPEQGYTTALTGTVLMREGRDYGWTVKATINATDSRGNYVGFKSYTFLFRGEKILHTLAPLSSDEMK
jgi:ketosteroid isomerase-like protein